MKPFEYVASEVDFTRGRAALPRIAADNDARFAAPSGEVLAVDVERWQRAQQYERDAWMIYNRQQADSRNHEWAEQFSDYADLPADLGHVIELGAGPFTNLRLILQGHRATSVTLLDPLASVYLKHRHCAYQGRTMNGYPVQLIDSAIEDWQPAPVYDTVVMVNTLPHCRDAQAVFERIRAALRPGGWLVWGEWPNETDPLHYFNAGHPLTPHAATLEAFMGEYEPVYRNGWFMIGRAR